MSKPKIKVKVKDADQAPRYACSQTTCKKFHEAGLILFVFTRQSLWFRDRSAAGVRCLCRLACMDIFLSMGMSAHLPFSLLVQMVKPGSRKPPLLCESEGRRFSVLHLCLGADGKHIWFFTLATRLSNRTYMHVNIFIESLSIMFFLG